MTGEILSVEPGALTSTKDMAEYEYLESEEANNIRQRWGEDYHVLAINNNTNHQ